MKSLFVVLSFIILPFVTKAQGVFGATHVEVRDTLIKFGFQYIKSDKSDIGTPYDLYKLPDGTIQVVCYFNKAEKCYEYRRIEPRTTLIERLEHLNKNFIKIDDTHWVSRDATVKVLFYAPTDDVSYYYISYQSMSDTDN